MLLEKDKDIIEELRCNARVKVTSIARKIKLPATTIYDRLRNHEKKGVVKKHVTLINFEKLGYFSTLLYAFKVNIDEKKALEEFLLDQPNVNTLHRTHATHDFLAEMIFQNEEEAESMTILLKNKFPSLQYHCFPMIDEIKKESFLGKSLDETKPPNLITL